MNLFFPQSASPSATFSIVNLDGPGEGFNDPTPAAPLGGNTGITLGQQRLIAFQHAANIWGGLITSPVIIRVEARFDPLSCTANSAVLGQAGPTTVHRDFAGAPLANTWYVPALADSLFGGDLQPNLNDISATFSSTIGTPGCLENSGWYFGLDRNAPGNQIDFVTVLLHELGHGLGFLSLVDLATGAKLLGFDDTYMRHLSNHTTSKPYPQMTNAERVAASINTGNLHWTGANVVAAGGGLTSGRHPIDGHVQMFAPNPAQLGSSVSHFDSALSPNELMEPSYAGPLHDVGLALELFADLGWVTLQAVVTVNPNSIDLATPPNDFTVGVTGGSFNDFGFGLPVVNFTRNGIILAAVRTSAATNNTLTAPFPANQGLSAGPVMAEVYNQTGPSSWSFVGSTSLVVNDTRPQPGVSSISDNPIDLASPPASFTITGNGFTNFGFGLPVVNFTRNGTVLAAVRTSAATNNTLTAPFPTNQGLSAGNVVAEAYNQTGSNSWNLVGSISLTITDTRIPPTAQVRVLNSLLICNPDGSNCRSFTGKLTASQGHVWFAASGNYSPYQAVTSSTLSNFTVEALGEGVVVTFPGSFNIAAGRRYALIITVDGSGNLLLLQADEGSVNTDVQELLTSSQAIFAERKDVSVARFTTH